MTNREQEALRRSYRGKVSRCQGTFFEQMISAACNLYRERQIADIEKTPEPMRPTKDLGGGKFIAHYTGKGQADYKGFLWGGRAVNFEAKYTDSGKMMQDRVTKDQAERLERAQQYGGVAFVLCSFGSVAFYRIPWVVWRDMKGNFGRKYIMPADVEQYRVKIGAPGVPLFLEGLEAQSTDAAVSGAWRIVMAAACGSKRRRSGMDKQKIKSIPRLTTDNPVDNFQTALNFTDISEDGWVWLRQPEMALTEYMRKLVKGHGSSVDLDCNDMELSETLTEHLFDDPKQSIDGLIAEHYTILWAYATLREKLKWYEDAGIPAIPDYGLNTIRRAINRYGTAPQLQMTIKEMSELTKAICNLQRATTFNYRNGAKIKAAHESVREEIADVYIMLAQLVEIVGKPEEVQQIVLEKLEQLKGALDGGEVQSE